ncbi:MAG: oxaloacetate decarboxylase alpha subunit, partial [Gammaproteobacteria bacterium]
YDVVVGPGNADISQIIPTSETSTTPAPAASGPANIIKAPLAGTVIDILVSNGQQVNDGDAVIILEAMKMETEIRSSFTGSVQKIMVSKGDSIQSDQDLIAIG